MLGNQEENEGDWPESEPTCFFASRRVDGSVSPKTRRKLLASRRVASSTYFPSNISFVLREQETGSDTPTVRDRMKVHITFFFIFEYTG